MRLSVDRVEASLGLGSQAAFQFQGSSTTAYIDGGVSLESLYTVDFHCIEACSEAQLLVFIFSSDSVTPFMSALNGTIAWLKPRAEIGEELPIGLNAGACNHPCLIIDVQVVQSVMRARILIVSTFHRARTDS